MAPILTARLDDVKGKGHAARFALSNLPGEGGRNDVASDEKRAAGALFERALNRAAVSPKNAADRLRYEHTSAVTRITSGLDIPNAIARFLLDPDLRRGLIVALSEASGQDVSVQTVVTIGAKAVTA